MRAGQLNKRVTLQDYTITRASTGEDTKTWFDVGTVWANIEPLGVRWREYFAAQQTVNEVTTRITIRYRADISPRHRFHYQGRYFYVEAIINTDEANRELQLLCSEVSR